MKREILLSGLIAIFTLLVAPLEAQAQVVPGDIQVTPILWDYGEVDVGMSSSKIFSIISIDGNQIDLLNLSIHNGDPSDFQITSAPILPHVFPEFCGEISQPGCEVQVTVNFLPTSIGLHEATFTIEVTDMLRPVIDVPLTGTGTGQVIYVDPLEHDFGDVSVGDASSVIITISNVDGGDLTVLNLYLQSESSSDFAITQAPPLPIVIGEAGSVDIEVIFSPTAEGYVTAVMVVESNDPVTPVIEVNLGGVGVETAPPPVTIDAILDFFDEAVANGTITGRGDRPARVEARLRAYRYLLIAAGTLIEGGYTGWACFTLDRLYVRADGMLRPRDLIVGEDRDELALMILALMGELGCPPS